MRYSVCSSADLSFLGSLVEVKCTNILWFPLSVSLIFEAFLTTRLNVIPPWLLTISVLNTEMICKVLKYFISYKLYLRSVSVVLMFFVFSGSVFKDLSEHMIPVRKGNRNTRKQNCIIDKRKPLLTMMQSLKLSCYLLLLVSTFPCRSEVQQQSLLRVLHFPQFVCTPLVLFVCLFVCTTLNLTPISQHCSYSHELIGSKVKQQHQSYCRVEGAWPDCATACTNFQGQMSREKQAQLVVGCVQAGKSPRACLVIEGYHFS